MKIKAVIPGLLIGIGVGVIGVHFDSLALAFGILLLGNGIRWR